MKIRTGGFRRNVFPVAVTFAFALLSVTTYLGGLPVGAQLAPQILAPTIAGASINVNAPGTESFWNQLTPLTIPLTATNTYGGTIPSVQMKIATNGTYILMEAVYSAAHQDNSSVTTGAPTAPTADFGLFYSNATIHRSDQFAVWWSMSQTPGPPPCMQVPYGTNEHGGTSPASIAGQGNVWRWTASGTDSGGATFPTAKYGAGTPLAGQAINYPHSFASDMLLNTSGFFILGAGSSNINSTVLTVPHSPSQPYDPFIVYDKGVYNTAAHTYTQVIARPLTTAPTTNIVQFQTGQVYNFAIGVWAGGPNQIPVGAPAPAGWTAEADNDETKSISTWVTVEFSGLAPGQSSVTTVTGPTSTVTFTQTQTTSLTSTSVSTTTATTTTTSVSTVTSASGPSFQLATAAILIALVVGLIAGMVAVTRVGGRKT